MAITTRSKDPQDLVQVLHLPFRNWDLLHQALIHRSHLNEAETDVESNERLEFLGDAVLSLVISQELFEAYPQLSEGHLSQIRAQLVRWDTLASLARSLSLGDYLILGRGEAMSGGRQRASNLAGALEALIGAAFLDGGLAKARRLILRLFKPELDKIASGQVVADSKSRLQHLVQGRWHVVPRYRLVSSEGPDHAKMFTVEVVVQSQVLGRGQGRSKKQAELAAASQALDTLSKAS